MRVFLAGATGFIGRHILDAPITRDELAMLRQGSHTSNDQFVRLFGFVPAPSV